MVIHLKYSSVCRLISPSFPSATVSPCSKSVSQFLFCKQVHWYHFFLDSAHKEYHRYFSSVWLTSLSMTISRCIHVAANGVVSFFLVAEEQLQWNTVKPLERVVYVDMKNMHKKLLSRVRRQKGYDYKLNPGPQKGCILITDGWQGESWIGFENEIKLEHGWLFCFLSSKNPCCFIQVPNYSASSRARGK